MLNRGELEERFDAFYYKPLFLETISRITKGIKLHSLAQFVIHPPEYPREYSDRGYQLIRSQNVRPTGVDLSANPVFFSTEFLASRKFTTAKTNDLLIVRSGVNAGDVATVEQDYDAAIVGADTLLARFTDQIHPKALQVFFWTDLGKLILSRYITGATNRHISPENFKRIIVPILAPNLQVRSIELFDQALTQKRQQEAQAQALLDSIDGYLLGELGITLPPEPDNTIENRVFKTSWRQVSGGRFDPEHTKPYYQQLVAVIQAKPHKRLHELSRFSQETWSQGQFFRDTFPYLEISGLDISTGEIKEISLVAVEEAPSRAKMIVRKGDLVISTTRPSRGAIAIFDQNEMCVGSTGFAVVRKTYNVSGAFLHLLLRSKLCLRQMEQRSSGGNYPAITQEELGQISVPVPSADSQEKIITHINAIRQQAQALRQQALDDFAKVKQEIEQMILG